MFNKIRLGLILAGLIVTLVFFNNQIRAMKTIKDNGVDVMFKLRPVDPRAFMQGDFMALAYSDDSFPEASSDGAASGKAIIIKDEKGVGTFARLDDQGTLASNELLINFARMFQNNATYGGERFFFQEGTAETYEAAEYGMFKVSPEGRAILVGLAGEDMKQLKPPPNP